MAGDRTLVGEVWEVVLLKHKWGGYIRFALNEYPYNGFCDFGIVPGEVDAVQTVRFYYRVKLICRDGRYWLAKGQLRDVIHEARKAATGQLEQWDRAVLNVERDSQ